jgi:acetyl esterase/lipase
MQKKTVMRRALAAGIAVAVTAVGAVVSGGTERAVAAGVTVKKLPNLTYYTDPGAVADLYEPARLASRPTPAVIFIHGGGWTGGDKSEWSTYAQSFTAATGWPSINIDYDMAAGNRTETELQDVKAAVYWIKTNAKNINTDPTRIALVGDSAGGNLAMLAGTTLASTTGGVKAVVSWSGLTDLPRVTADEGCLLVLCSSANPGAPGSQYAGSLIQGYEGGTEAADPAQWTATSPVDQVTTASPRMLLFNETDELVPVDQLTEMATSLVEHGVPAATVVYPGTSHAMGYAAKAWPTTEKWLKANL